MLKRRTRRAREICATPIINEEGQIVGWTHEAPSIRADGRMHHPQAEALVHSPVTCTYVQIVDRDNAQRAGAPVDWPEPWRCLAIVPTEPEKVSS